MGFESFGCRDEAKADEAQAAPTNTGHLSFQFQLRQMDKVILVPMSAEVRVLCEALLCARIALEPDGWLGLFADCFAGFDVSVRYLGILFERRHQFQTWNLHTIFF